MSKKNDIRHGRHCVFKMHVHLIFVAKYRRKVFDADAINRLRTIFAKVCADFEAQRIEMDGRGRSCASTGGISAQGGRILPRTERRGLSRTGSHDLTLIRIPARKIWPDPGSRPDPFDGTLTPIEPSTPDTCSEQHPEPDITAPRMSADTIIMGQEETDERPPEDPGHAQAHDGLILTAQPPETAQGFNLPQAPSTDPGQQFLQWLRQEVSARHLDVNTPNARIHVVSEGVLLVSPAVFKDYAARHPDHPGWEYVQKRFIKLKLHQKQTDGTNVHRYLVRGARRQSGDPSTQPAHTISRRGSAACGKPSSAGISIVGCLSGDGKPMASPIAPGIHWPDPSQCHAYTVTPVIPQNRIRPRVESERVFLASPSMLKKYDLHPPRHADWGR